MPDILKIETDQWQLNVWSNNIASRQAKLLQALQKRGKSSLPISVIKFSEPTMVYAVVFDGDVLEVSQRAIDTIQIPQPLFFENSVYEFEFDFGAQQANFKGSAPRVLHRNRRIEESFHYVSRSNVLRGTIDTANHIGWLRIPIQLGAQHFSISFEVLPTKMDMHHDLQIIHQVIDQTYPLWRFSLTEKTEQSFSRSRKKVSFEILWLAHFERLHKGLTRSVHKIMNAPHTRLLERKRYVKSDQLKGKLTVKTIHHLSEARTGVLKKHLISSKRLSNDTPENRFVKSVVCSMVEGLSQIQILAFKLLKAPEGARLSDSFMAQLESWKEPFSRALSSPFFKEVGLFKELKRESLVLHQKTGYADVYKIWQVLKLYLDFFGGDADVSIKSVDQLYELWCFLEIKQIIESLGFSEDDAKMKLSAKIFEYHSLDGLSNALNFVSQKGVSIRLAHEPKFNKTTEPVRVSTVSQKPDIYVEVSFPGGTQLVWLFDAKYRVDDGERVPDDAINQMHRYRDALIYKKQNRNYRQVFGAYALYPGYFDDQSVAVNPYDNEINEINIGAFPLLPSNDGQGSVLLRSFLEKHLTIVSADECFLQPSARISTIGMRQTRYDDLVLIVPSAPKRGRDQAYLDSLEDGSAKWYHIPKETLDGQYQNIIIDELRYLAIGVIPDHSSARKINFVWQIESVELASRCELSAEQSGMVSDSKKHYWLFKLSNAVRLDGDIEGMPMRDFRKGMKIVRHLELKGVKKFSALSDVYPQLLCP